MTLLNKQANLFRTVHASIGALGVSNTIKVLEQALNKRYENKKAFHVFVLVTDKLGITIQQTQQVNLRTDKRKITIAFCVHFLSTYFEYTYEEINDNLKLGLSKETMYKHHNIIKNANIRSPKSDIDKLIVLHFEDLKTEILQYKTEFKNGN